MERSDRAWLTPLLLGLGFIVLLIVSFIVIGEPKDAKHPADEIQQWYTDNKDAVQIGAIISIGAAVLLIFFGAYLRTVLEEAGGGPMLPILVLIGLTIVAIGAAIDNMFLFATAERADDIPATSVQTIQAIWDNDFLPFLLGVTVFLWSVGISVVKTGAVPKWLGWVAIALGVISVTPIGFAGALGAALWIIVASILLSMRARSGPARPAQETAA